MSWRDSPPKMPKSHISLRTALPIWAATMTTEYPLMAECQPVKAIAKIVFQQLKERYMFDVKEVSCSAADSQYDCFMLLITFKNPPEPGSVIHCLCRTLNFVTSSAKCTVYDALSYGFARRLAWHYHIDKVDAQLARIRANEPLMRQRATSGIDLCLINTLHK